MRLRRAVTVGVMLTAVLGGGGAMVAASAPSAKAATMVVNGDFENGTTGWKTAAPGQLSITTGMSGYGALLTNGSSGPATVALNDVVNTVASTQAGATYTASAWIRTDDPKQSVGVRLMEYSGTTYLGQAKGTAWLTGRSWQHVTVSYVARTSGASLDLNVLGWSMPAGTSIVIDDVAMTSTASSAPSPSPSTSTSSTTTSPTSSTTTSPTSSTTTSSTSSTTTSPTSSTTTSPTSSTTTSPTSSTTTSPTSSTTTSSAAPTGWNLVWDDEFNGTSVDATKWNVRDNDYMSYDQACIYARNVSEGNGVLTITSKREAAACGGGRAYTTGYLDTIGKASWNYGRFEMRAKMALPKDASKGLWPAFWLRPNDGGAGEIDTIEQYGTGADGSGGDGHEFGETHATIWDTYAPSIHEGDDYQTGVDTSAGFHTYATEWEPGIQRFYFDGTLMYTRSTSTTSWYSSVYDAGRPFNIRLNQQVGGSWAGSPDASTLFPASYQIDYVRVYQR